MLFPVFNIAGMMLDNFTSEHVPVDMRINFRGGDGFMSQHALNGPQIGAAFQQMGGKGMAERVRADILGDAGLFRQFFNHVKHHDAGDTIAPSCQKYVIFVSFLDFPRLRSANQYFISLMARGEIGTRRCLLPLPSTLMNPSSK